MLIIKLTFNSINFEIYIFTDFLDNFEHIVLFEFSVGVLSDCVYAELELELDAAAVLEKGTNNKTLFMILYINL